MIRRLFTRVRRGLARRLGRARLLKTVGQLREGGDRAELARALRNLGELERRLFPGAAREHYEQAVAIFREVGDPLKLAHTVRHLGDVHHEAGRGELAEPCYREALALYRSHEPRHPLNLANAIRSLAVLEGEAGDMDEAIGLWQEAHDLYAAVKVPAGVAEAAARLALLVRCGGDLPGSRQWLERASAAADRSGDPDSLKYIREVTARIES